MVASITKIQTPLNFLLTLWEKIVPEDKRNLAVQPEARRYRTELYFNVITDSLLSVWV
jgi:hypothetical protein